MSEFLVLRTGEYYASRYPEDTKRIVDLLRDHGYETTPAIAAEAWHRHCECMMAAGWMDLYSQEGWIVDAILGQTQRVEIKITGE